MNDSNTQNPNPGDTGGVMPGGMPVNDNSTPAADTPNQVNEPMPAPSAPETPSPVETPSQDAPSMPGGDNPAPQPQPEVPGAPVNPDETPAPDGSANPGMPTPGNVGQ